MRYSPSILAALAAAPLLASARPVKSRAASANDALVFKFASVLEDLETQFYSEGIAKFSESDFSAAGFSSALIATQSLTAIQSDEATHGTFLKQALKDNGAEALNCSFDFSSVLTDVPTMAGAARLVEYLGVGAYLGGATLIDDPVFLDAAASILTVEARHQTVLNILSGSGSAIPQAFDIPFTPQEVLSVAGPFITGNCDLGITATNALAVTNTDPIAQGTLLQFSGNNVGSGQFCNMIVGGMPFAINLPIENCVVPPGINGPVALWITSDNNPLINNVIDRDTTKQVAGPAIIFVDAQPETLGQLVRGSGSGSSTTTTTTITPDQAASIIASASSTAGDSAPTDGSSNSNSGANGAAAPASTPLPQNFTGNSPDGKVDVIGLSMVPRPSPSATDSASASASTTDSASATSTSA
ncbi:ferritin-like domain-containing protein [Mycena amicta]|nr:ferritin-like domain-containing protein [Mycena amicta]